MVGPRGISSDFENDAVRRSGIPNVAGADTAVGNCGWCRKRKRKHCAAILGQRKQQGHSRSEGQCFFEESNRPYAERPIYGENGSNRRAGTI